ncbi:MAG TPA: radical SAM family heme chaperone HemW [Polyangiaceae bacterium]|nr:radical SAM family heme chaperone HemW [Polyangiaceae bacterium]
MHGAKPSDRPAFAGAASAARSALPVAPEDTSDGIGPAAAAPRTVPGLGVYVHFPYCLKKCPYCDFLSVAADRAELPHGRYADAVLAELARRAPELGRRRLRSVFFGGGTPSLWHAEDLGRVLRAILDTFDAPAEVEVTVECNPTSLDRARAAALIDQGVNRLSVGVQSLSEERLRFLGRLHDGPGGQRAVRDALAVPGARVSADLIFGVHGQSARDARAEVATLADAGVGHLSAYALTIEPGTQFGALARRGRLPLLGDDTVADSFLAVHDELTARGFEHYEISNYAQPGQRSQHNLGYWLGREYLGLGAGAWGTVRTRGRLCRYRNTPAHERYLSSAERWPDEVLWSEGGLIASVEPIDAETALSERILLGLRLAEGVDLDAAGRELGVDPWPRERALARDRLLARGLLRADAGRVHIPTEHWLLADGIIRDLM